MSNKILSISLRPKNLDQLIGIDDIVENVKTQFKTNRIPHFFIISGESGCGKTTLSRIIAIMLQNKDKNNINYDINISNYDIKEINGSDKNGVDDIRDIIDSMNYKPLSPSICKIIIIDEAHQLTTAAQNALLKITEDTPEHVYFIFCTNNDSKILLTLKRRAYILKTHGIDEKSMCKLLNNAKEVANFQNDQKLKDLQEALLENDITSPGFILQAAEKFFSGADIYDCIFNIHSSEINTKELCQYISKGDFKSCKSILKTVKKEDIVMLRLCINGYLKAILLNNGSLRIAQSIKVIGEECYELPIFIANLRIACNIITPKTE